MDALTRCKGVDNAIVPSIIETSCPRCGAELELFSTEPSVTCVCGVTVTNKHNEPLTTSTANT